MSLDPLLLARLQFAANITFHILFPSITIALGVLLLYFKIRYSLSKDESWMRVYVFFTKVFALSFALGVVSGVTMSFQFGTNWPGFMERVGNIAGPLLAYEVLTAFFLEATFLGIMLFGFRRVPNWLHTGATALVAVGTIASAFWILVLNSWMHTPAGFEMIPNAQGVLQAHVTSWWQVIFNPSMPYRLTHMLLASGLTAAFLMAGLSAYRQLRGDTGAAAKKGLATGLVLAAILTPLQFVVGHEHGINTAQHQPAKLAAMEGAWNTQEGAPLVLFAWPDPDTQTNRFSLEIPKASSLIITGDPNGRIQGLEAFEEHPPVTPIFFGFRLMIGIGVLMLLTSWGACMVLWRRQTLNAVWLRGLVAMMFSGNIATVAGWYVTEMGRQPWLVQGVLKTQAALGPAPPEMILSTLLIYLAIYAFLIVAYVGSLLYLARKAADEGPSAPERSDLPAAERRTGLLSSRPKNRENRHGR